MKPKKRNSSLYLKKISSKERIFIWTITRKNCKKLKKKKEDIFGTHFHYKLCTFFLKKILPKLFAKRA